jgi:hypothetical protein
VCTSFIPWTEKLSDSVRFRTPLHEPCKRIEMLTIFVLDCSDHVLHCVILVMWNSCFMRKHVEAEIPSKLIKFAHAFCMSNQLTGNFFRLDCVGFVYLEDF